MNETVIAPIAHIENDFDTKFGIPRQSLLVNALKSLELLEPQGPNAARFALDLLLDR